jgi:hypothetical protein
MHRRCGELSNRADEALGQLARMPQEFLQLRFLLRRRQFAEHYQMGDSSKAILSERLDGIPAEIQATGVAIDIRYGSGVRDHSFQSLIDLRRLVQNGVHGVLLSSHKIGGSRRTSERPGEMRLLAATMTLLCPVKRDRRHPTRQNRE